MGKRMNGRNEENNSSRSQMRDKTTIKQSSSDETATEGLGEVAIDRLDGEPGEAPLTLWVRTASSSFPCFQNEFSNPYTSI